MTDALAYAPPEDADPASIPIIGFAPFRLGAAYDRQAVAGRIAQACRSTGFFFLINHGVPSRCAGRCRGRRRRSSIGRWASRCNRRRCATGGGAATCRPAAPPRAASRRLAGAELGIQDGLGGIAAADLPEFVETMVINQRAVRRLGDDPLRAFSLAFGLEEERLAAEHTHPLATFGLNFHPARAPDDPDGTVGVGAHCDASSSTVLLQDDVGGLEARDRSGRWIQAPPVPGAYVINIGDTLMGWSDGQFVSTPHRVVSRRPIDRHSSTMFMNPNGRRWWRRCRSSSPRTRRRGSPPS